MLRVHLIRHAAFEGVGQRMVGRTPGVSLSAHGRAQARGLADEFASRSIAAVYTSPLERAQETAAAIAAPHNVVPITSDAFAELDLGDWTGSELEDLHAHSAWRDFNTLRSLTRIPGGELMLETQTRAIAGLLDIQRHHVDATVAIISHADVIRAILGHLLGMPMDHLLRLEIAPASYSTIELHGPWPQIHCIGNTSARLPDPGG
ncbi:MAG TPA: histidine phosphatase family protein [Longimicrobiales bacterium]|nr:histidine phosphatase family protein [Longimicrobiales bacterium]